MAVFEFLDWDRALYHAHHLHTITRHVAAATSDKKQSQ
jgi:hypothetical protein